MMIESTHDDSRPTLRPTLLNRSQIPPAGPMRPLLSIAACLTCLLYPSLDVLGQAYSITQGAVDASTRVL